MRLPRNQRGTPLPAPLDIALIDKSGRAPRRGQGEPPGLGDGPTAQPDAWGAGRPPATCVAREGRFTCVATRVDRARDRRENMQSSGEPSSACGRRDAANALGFRGRPQRLSPSFPHLAGAGHITGSAGHSSSPGGPGLPCGRHREPRSEAGGQLHPSSLFPREESPLPLCTRYRGPPPKIILGVEACHFSVALSHLVGRRSLGAPRPRRCGSIPWVRRWHRSLVLPRPARPAWPPSGEWGVGSEGGMSPGSPDATSSQDGS